MEEKIAVAEYHRAILGLSAPFDIRQLKTSYRNLARLWHPDFCVSDSSKFSEANEKTKHINLAYEFLSELLETLGGTYSFKPPSTSTSVRYARHNWKRSEYQPKREYEGKKYTTGFPDKAVPEIFVKSSHIVSIGYNRFTTVLYIKFAGDALYRYLDFPETLFRDFVSAESPGKFAHQWIYRSFKYERC